jgi:hypothetical protein
VRANTKLALPATIASEMVPLDRGKVKGELARDSFAMANSHIRAPRELTFVQAAVRFVADCREQASPARLPTS